MTYLSIFIDDQELTKEKFAVSWMHEITVKVKIQDIENDNLGLEKIYLCACEQSKIYRKAHEKNDKRECFEDFILLYHPPTVIGDALEFTIRPQTIGPIKLIFYVFPQNGEKEGVIEEHTIELISPFTGLNSLETHPSYLIYDDKSAGLIKRNITQEIIDFIKNESKHQVISIRGSIACGKSTVIRAVVEQLQTPEQQDQINNRTGITVIPLSYGELLNDDDVSSQLEAQTFDTAGLIPPIRKYVEGKIAKYCRSVQQSNESSPDLKTYQEGLDFSYLENTLSICNTDKMVFVLDELDRLAMANRFIPKAFFKIFDNTIFPRLSRTFGGSNYKSLHGVVLVADWEKFNARYEDEIKNAVVKTLDLQVFNKTEIETVIKKIFGDLFISNDVEKMIKSLRKQTNGNPLLLSIMLDHILQICLKNNGWVWDDLPRIDQKVLAHAVDYIENLSYRSGFVTKLDRLTKDEKNLYGIIKKDQELRITEQRKKTIESLEAKGLVTIVRKDGVRYAKLAIQRLDSEYQ